MEIHPPLIVFQSNSTTFRPIRRETSARSLEVLRSVYLLTVVSLSLVCFSHAPSAQAQMNGSSDIAQDGQWEEFDQLIGQSESSMMANPAEALELARGAEMIALSLSTSTKSAEAVATSLWLQSEAMIRLNQTGDVLPLLNRALETIGEQTVKSKLGGDLLLARGRVSRLSGHVETALESFHEAYEIFADLNIARSQSIALQSVGSIYNDARSFERALEYYERADEIYSDDPSLDISSANNRANTLKELGRFGEALEQFYRALTISSKIDSSLLEARILTNLASLQIVMGNLEAAEMSADDALELLRGSDDNNWSRFVSGIKAQVAYQRGHITEAEGYLSTVFADMDLTQTSVPFRDMHEIAYKIFGTAGESGPALQHLEAFKRLDDHGRDISASANMALMGAQFDFANQELEIQQLKTGQLERDIHLAEARARQQRLVLYAVLVLSLVVTSSITIGYVSLRRHRNEIRATNINLQEMVGLLNIEIERRHETEADLRKAKEQAESANHAKSQFLANMSHELRTPLNAIIGFAEIIAKEILGSNGKPEYKDYANDIHISGKHLLSMLNDVLDMSRIDAGSVDIDECDLDLHSLVAESLRAFEEEASLSNKVLSLSSDDPDLVVKADERMVRQVLTNLLSNAMKFTNPNGTIGVHVEIIHDGGVAIVVQDDGVGIPADKLSTILEPFSQAEDSYSRSQGGIGLGLPIARSLVEIHGGSLKIESVFGEGTQARILFPRSRVVQKAA